MAQTCHSSSNIRCNTLGTLLCMIVRTYVFVPEFNNTHFGCVLEYNNIIWAVYMTSCWEKGNKY